MPPIPLLALSTYSPCHLPNTPLTFPKTPEAPDVSQMAPIPPTTLGAP